MGYCEGIGAHLKGRFGEVLETLSTQLFDILKEQKWRVGLWNGSSLSSPLGVWVSTSRSVAMDKASAKRGYASSFNPLGVPNGWDFPVVLGLDLNIKQCGRHKRFKSGNCIRRYLTAGRNMLDLMELNIVDCSFYRKIQPTSSGVGQGALWISIYV